MGLIIVPAYGRDYRSAKAAEADFNAGKDFKIADISCRWDGSYCSKPDLKAGGYNQVKIRYSKLSRVTFVNF